MLEIGRTNTSYKPSANGQVERYNRSIAQIIRCCVDYWQERWNAFMVISMSTLKKSVTMNRRTMITLNMMKLGIWIMISLDLMLGSEGGTD